MFFRRLVSIFVSPSQVFDDIRESRVSWWQPWVMVSVIVMVSAWLMTPVQVALLEANPELAGNVEDAGAMMRVMQAVQVFVSPVVMLIFTLIFAAISYVLVTLASKEATFKKYFTLVMFAEIVASVGFLATVLILRARGVDQIATPEDLKVGLSLRLLAPESGPVLGGILGSLEFFAIWAFVLIVLGLRRVFNFTLGTAIACTLPLWLLYTAFTVIGELMNAAR
jgi:hypothetical protein